MKRYVSSSLVVLMIFAAGCAASSRAADGAPPASQPSSSGLETLTGTLKGGYVGVGGEHSGWMLLRGGKETDVEIDPGTHLDEAKRLDGKAVKVTGRFVQKKYVERGTVRIFRLETLEAAQGTSS